MHGISRTPLAVLQTTVQIPAMATVEITSDNFKDTIDLVGDPT